MSLENERVQDEWYQSTPHFNGTLPHRYEIQLRELIPEQTRSKELCCRYCGKPKGF